MPRRETAADALVHNVPTEEARADYEVSGTDWLTLIEKFGLAAHLQTRGEEGAAQV